MYAEAFRNLSIRRKLRAIIMITSGAALALACAAFLTYDWFSYRKTVARQLQIMAGVVADQSTAALDFRRDREAEAILASLKAEGQIACAAVYTRDGTLFTRYVRTGGDPLLVPLRPGPDGEQFQEGHLVIFMPILSGGERIGTFHLRSDMRDARRRRLLNLGGVGLVLLVAAFAALLLSSKLEGVITGPVMHLAEAVRAVSTEKNYSVRAAKHGHDELGLLIDGFNEMLSEIQARDEALARARDELETRVEERTRELQREIALHKETGKELIEAQQIAHMGSWEWEIGNNRLAWSDELYRIYGLEPRQFDPTYEAFLERVHPGDLPRVRDAVERALKNHQPFAFEERIIRPDGEVRDLYSWGEVVRDGNDRVVRLVGVCQDVTERKKAEQELAERAKELERSNAELEQFAYVASHDLQEPLRMVASYVQLLAKRYQGRLDDDADVFIKFAVDGAIWMQRLIHDLLAYSRVTHLGKRLPLIEAGPALQAALSNLRVSIGEAEAVVTHDVLPAVMADFTGLTELFQNLIGNAIKFRGKRRPEIHVGVARQDKDWIFSVKDNGIGIDLQYGERVFVIFQRLHSRDEYPGTGIGLAICRKIVEHHGGRIWVEGQPGTGSTFFFTLPVSPSGPGRRHISSPRLESRRSTRP